MQRPLVSVLTPTYQAADTLGRALASLTTQSYPNWDCVVVDDGSDDNTAEVLAQVTDSRIRHFRLPRNMGRGVARKAALEEARGDLVCALDADDWFYPGKLESQVRVYEQNSEVAAVTVGMAVTTGDGRLVGVQGHVSRTSLQSLAGPRGLRFPFGPTMVPIALAREVGYNTNDRRGCDLDFFLRLLCGRDRVLCHLDQIGYAYQGHTCRTMPELLFGHRCSREVYRRHLRQFPFDCGYLLLYSYFKSAVYRGATAVGLADWVSLMRFAAPTDLEAAEFLGFQAALEGVRA